MAPTFYDFEISGKGLLQYGMPEEAPLGDIAHKQLDNDGQLVYSLVKTGGGFCRRGPPDSLLQVGMRRGVIQLDCLDATEVVVVSCVLGVAGGGGE